MAVAAVVVCHNSDLAGLSETLAAVSQQQSASFQTFVAARPGESAAGDTARLPITQKNFEDAIAELVPQLTDFDWVWFLSPGQLPAANALSELLRTAESSTSAAIVGPKIMQLAAQDVIDQFGLTLTPRSSLHHIVRAELDQAQHDNLQDVLGVCLEGSIISTAKVIQAGGATTALDSVAADLELAIRLRLRGMRVLLSPAAKIYGSSQARTSPRTADFQLKLFYYRPVQSFIFWLFLPLLVIAESLWLMLRKQPEKVFLELSSGFTVFFTAAKIWLSRRSLRSRERRNLKSLRSLYASKTEVRHARELRSFVEPEPQTSANNLVIGDALGLFSSGAIWVAAALLLVSWRFFPQGTDLAGAALLPLGDSWLNIFTATGSGFQSIGTGFYAPSDPFNWLLLALGTLTFWAPGFSLVLLFFMAKSLAFAFAFKALALFSKRTWVVTLASLVYAFWPAFTTAQSEARLPQIISHILIPALVFAAAKSVGINVSVQTKPASWAFTSTAALTFAAISIATPSLTPILAIALAVLVAVRYKKIGYLVWVPVPLLVLWMPTVWYRAFELQQPLSLLADPGLGLSSVQTNALSLLVTSGDLNLIFAIALSAVALVAVFAFSTVRTRTSVSLVSMALLALAGAWLFQQVRFVGNPVVGETGQEWVNGSPHALLSITGLCLAMLFAISLDELKWARAAALLAFPAAGALGVLAMFSGSSLTYNDGRVVPALVLAEAKQSSSLKMLVLQPEGSGRYSATLVSHDGIHLADLNTSYRFALAERNYQDLAKVAADLISASPGNLGERLQQLSIGYVLVPISEDANGRELVSKIDSVMGLSSIGETEFGRLWRVAGLDQLPLEPPTSQDLWSVTKAVQLFVLVLFILLAIPTKRREVSAGRGGEIDSFAEEDPNE